MSGDLAQTASLHGRTRSPAASDKSSTEPAIIRKDRLASTSLLLLLPLALVTTLFLPKMGLLDYVSDLYASLTIQSTEAEEQQNDSSGELWHAED